MNVLHICASPRPIDQSASKQLAAAFFAKLAELNPDVNVTNVDLYHSPPPFLGLDAYRCIWQPVFQPGYEPTDTEKKAAAYSVAQCAQLKESEILVLTMPMWNFGMPAIMKAWLDQVIAPNEVFAPDPSGPQPLHHVRKAILLISSDEVFKEGDPHNALMTELDAILNYIGITDIAIAWADGQDPVLHFDWKERKAMAVEAAQELAEEVAQMGTTA